MDETKRTDEIKKKKTENRTAKQGAQKKENVKYDTIRMREEIKILSMSGNTK